MSEFVVNWARRRRGCSPSVAKDFAMWYGSLSCTAQSLAEGWSLYEAFFWEVD